MHLYDRALLNASGVARAGLRQERSGFPAGEVQRDHQGNPTGCSSPSRMQHSLFHTAKGPNLSREDQLNSSRLFFRELTALASPRDRCRRRISELSRRLWRGERTAPQWRTVDSPRLQPLTQKPKQGTGRLQSWTKMTKPATATTPIVSTDGRNARFLCRGLRRLSRAAPDMLPVMESELKAVIQHLVEHRWRFACMRHTTRQSSGHLNVYERGEPGDSV